MTINSYKDLEVWQTGMAVAKACYLLTRAFPREEMFGLTSQIRRAAASVPASIAEGHGRESTADFIRMLRIAQGSLKETETHVLLAVEVGLSTQDKANTVLELCDRQGRMQRSLIRSLQSREEGR